MLKFIANTVVLTTFILLAACGGNVNQTEETNIQATNSAPSSVEADFKSEILIHFTSYHDQVNESELPVLKTLETNLIALVEHDHTLFKSGFVNEDLANSMDYYYGEQFLYRFTDIDSMEHITAYKQWNITVVGQRMDTTSQAVEDIKMLYAIRQNELGEWVIYTID